MTGQDTIDWVNRFRSLDRDGQKQVEQYLSADEKALLHTLLGDPEPPVSDADAATDPLQYLDILSPWLAAVLELRLKADEKTPPFVTSETKKALVSALIRLGEAKRISGDWA